MKTAFITGGAGFIGSNLALALQEKGIEATIIDNFSTADKRNLEGFKGTLIQKDVSKEDLSSIEKHDCIFHQAAITDPRYDDDDEMRRSNGEGFSRIIALAKKWSAKLIYASSASMYGNGPVPMKESQPKDLQSAYGKSKHEMDLLAQKLIQEKALKIVGLRYFNVFGPRETHKGKPASMIYHLRKQMMQDKNPRIFKWGEQKRDHIYVKDAVSATLKAATAKSGIYNIGTGTGTDFNALVKILNEVLGTNKKPEYFDMPYDPNTYQLNTQADTTLAEQELHFIAKHDLKTAIQDYHDWLSANGE